MRSFALSFFIALPDFYRTLIKIQLTLQHIIRATKQCEKNPLMVSKKPMR